MFLFFSLDHSPANFPLIKLYETLKLRVLAVMIFRGLFFGAYLWDANMANVFCLSCSLLQNNLSHVPTIPSIHASCGLAAIFFRNMFY